MPLTAQQAQIVVGAASAFFAAVLAVVTVLYYIETRNHTAEMKRTRRPVVKANLVIYHDIHGRLSIENIGRGAARKITAKWGFTDADITETIHSIQLDPDERHLMLELPFEDEVSTPAGINNELADREGLLWVELEYEDEFGEVYCDHEELNIGRTVESRIGTEQQDPSDVERIIDGLEEIHDAIESL